LITHDLFTFVLQNPIPTTKPGVEPRRPGRPVDITSLCRLSPTHPNHIEISWAAEYGRVSLGSYLYITRTWAVCRHYQ